MRSLRLPRLLVLALTGVGTVLLGLGPVAVPAPASAAVTGSTSSPDVTLYDQCQTHVAHYAIDVSPGTYFWRLEIQTVDPHGMTSEGTVLTSNVSATTGTASTIFCGSETPGTWTIHAAGFMELIPGVQIPYSLPDSSFTVSSAQTRTTLTKERLRHHRVRLVTSVADQRPGGFGATEGAPVILQRLVDGTWQKVHGSSDRTSRGRATKVVTTTRTATYRAVTTGIGYFGGSTSPPLTVRR